MNTISTLPWISRKAGGLQESVKRLHQALHEIPGVNVSVIALLDEYSAEDVPGWLPLPVSLSEVVGPPEFGFSPSYFPRLLQANADILHTNGIWQYPSIAVSRWHEKTGRPYVISPHGMLDPWAVGNSAWRKETALAFYERRHLEGAACIRALCESEAQAIRQFGLRNPICIIPNAIDTPEQQNGNLKISEPPWHDDQTAGKKILLYLGRLHPKKGLLNLIRGWAAVRPNEWILAIAGWDQAGHESELKRLCMDLNLPFIDSQTQNGKPPPSAPVCFLGPQFGRNKAACYAHCDAFILPSFSEGLPMVILEAWAYRKPVLMTPQCNLPEGFTAEAAIRIEPNVDSIVAGLQSLSRASSKQHQDIGERGFALVMARFNWAKCANDMAQVYSWILGLGPKPAVVF
jgi:poly(glycerol-phosphate) alpha-glucosyltransferase